MMKTRAAIVCLLAILTVGVASAKSYNFTLATSATAGTHELTAGQRYSVQVDGAEALFTNANGKESFRVPVKIEQSATKYSTTSVETSKAGDKEVVQAIRLGKSTTRLVFAQ